MCTPGRTDYFAGPGRSTYATRSALAYNKINERISMTAAPDTMRPFDSIIGRWRTSGTVLDEHGQPVAEIDGTDEYEWMPGGMWVIHRVDVTIGDDHVHALELIGEHNPETNTYVMRAFDGSGSFAEMTAHPNTDGSWTFLGDRMRSTLWPSEDRSSMTARWERQIDSGTWLHWMDMGFAAIAS